MRKRYQSKIKVNYRPYLIVSAFVFLALASGSVAAMSSGVFGSASEDPETVATHTVADDSGGNDRLQLNKNTEIADKQAAAKKERDAKQAAQLRAQQKIAAEAAATAAREQQEAVASAKSLPVGSVAPAALLSELNSRRGALGVAPLKLDARLNNSAQQKCDDMEKNAYFAHDNPDTGKKGIEYARAAVGPYGAWGENLITGYKASPAAMYDGWWESAPHKKAALDRSYKLTGYGVCGDPSRPTAVQHFYRP